MKPMFEVGERGAALVGEDIGAFSDDSCGRRFHKRGGFGGAPTIGQGEIKALPRKGLAPVGKQGARAPDEARQQVERQENQE